VACYDDHDWLNLRIGSLLAVLHGIEAVIWATAYWWLGALRSPQEALLYSVDSITTRGASGLILEPGWRGFHFLGYATVRSDYLWPCIELVCSKQAAEHRCGG